MIKKIFSFYAEGFRSMTVGRKLWALILIKLFILFAVLKLFFFHDYLGERCADDAERADLVRKELLDTCRTY